MHAHTHCHSNTFSTSTSNAMLLDTILQQILEHTANQLHEDIKTEFLTHRKDSTGRVWLSYARFTAHFSVQFGSFTSGKILVAFSNKAAVTRQVNQPKIWFSSMTDSLQNLASNLLPWLCSLSCEHLHHPKHASFFKHLLYSKDETQN